MKRILVLLVLLAIGFLLLLLFSVWQYERGMTLAQEVFQLPEDIATDFLTEEIALEYANRLLTQTFPSIRWKPDEEDRSVAPDGTKDQYLLRNTINPRTRGSLYFINSTPDDKIPNRVAANLTLRKRELVCVLMRMK